MRVTFAVISTLTILTVALGIPTPKRKEEVEVIPLEKHNPFGDEPIIDTDAAGWGNPFASSFGGLFENIESVMMRMRQQMETLLKSFPINGGNSSTEIPDFPLEGPLPGFPALGEIDLGKGNTTSVTKIIDGHKVIINETEYKKQDDFGGAFFKVRIIDVKPEEEVTTKSYTEEVTTVTAQAPAIKDREPIENSIENEIPKSREVTKLDGIETFDEIDFVPLPVEKKTKQEGYAEWNNVKPLESVEDNSVDGSKTNQPIDLGRDIYVNQILVDSGAPINPDAEVIFVPQNYRNSGQFEKFVNLR